MAPKGERMGSSWRSAGFFLFGALGLLGLASSGCTGTYAAVPSMYGYSVVSASNVPMGIYDYPSYYWNGGYAYLVNNSWYYPTEAGWVVFQQEPYDLYRYRRQYYTRYPQYDLNPSSYGGYPSYPSGGVQVAPPARRPAAPQVDYGYRGSVQAAPPVYRAPTVRMPADVGPSVGSPVQVAPPAVRAPTVVPAPPERAPVQSAPPVPREGVQSAPPAPRGRR